jgi:uncharacterized membrane protein YdjX (TVP38/TMEM64 family)
VAVSRKVAPFGFWDGRIRHRGNFRVERSFARVLFVPLAVAIGIFLIVHFNVHTFFMDRERLSELLTSYGATSVLLFIALQIAQVVVSPLPGDVTGLLGGYLYGPVLGIIYSTIGLTIGSWIAFVLARFLGFPFVERIIRPSTIRKYDYFLEHKGLAISFIFFLIPGFPKDTLCYILGLSHMRTRNFLVVSTTGRLLGTTLLSLQGSSLRNDQDVFFFILLGVTALIILGGYFHVGWWLRSFLKKRKGSRPALPPPQPQPERVSQPPEGGADDKQG